jgi:hypothetical protein
MKWKLYTIWHAVHAECFGLKYLYISVCQPIDNVYLISANFGWNSLGVGVTMLAISPL